MKLLKSLAIAATVAATLTDAAHACDPPDVGDQYKLGGQTFEIVKVNSATGYFRFCVRAVGSKQECH